MKQVALIAFALAYVGHSPCTHAYNVDLLNVVVDQQTEWGSGIFEGNTSYDIARSGWGPTLDDSAIEKAELTPLEALIVEQAFPFTRKVIKQQAWVRKHMHPGPYAFGGVSFLR